jgi:hypothetical protein
MCQARCCHTCRLDKDKCLGRCIRDCKSCKFSKLWFNEENEIRRFINEFNSTEKKI